MARDSKKKLEKLLEECTPEFDTRTVNEDVFERIRDELVKWGGEELRDYNPLVEMAKLANTMSVPDALRYKCNSEIASYMYPKVKSLEIKSKEDKTVNLNIRIAGYAQKKEIEIEAEEVLLEDGDGENKLDYATFALGITDAKGQKLNS